MCSLRLRCQGRVSWRLAWGLYDGPSVFFPAVPFLQLVMLFFHCTGLGGSEQQSNNPVQLNVLLMNNSMKQGADYEGLLKFKE